MLIRGKITTKRKKIVGRGYGSGKGGHTASRGTKGQKSRSGYNPSPFFEGGQNPIIKSLPYLRGFKRKNPAVSIVKLADIERIFSEGDKIDLKVLKEKNLVKYDNVKILSGVKISKAFIFDKNLKFSKSALNAIEKVKGKVE